MRVIRTAAFVLIILAAVVLVTDRVAVTVAQQRVSDQASAALGAPAHAELHGTLVGLRLLTGTVPRIDVTAEDVPVLQGATIDRIAVTLTGVRVTREYLRQQPDALPPAEDGRFRAEVGVGAIGELLPMPGLIDVDTEGDRLRLSVGNLAVEATLDAEDGRVVVRPQTPLAAVLGLERLEVDLSDQAGRPHVETVDVRGDVVVLRGRLLEVHRPTRSSLRQGAAG